jgi:hypothetical protein
MAHFRRSPVWRSWNRADLVVSKLGSGITERRAVCTMVLLILPETKPAVVTVFAKAFR